MSNFFALVQSRATSSRCGRLKAESEKIKNQPQSAIATLSGFDPNSGSYTATTADGGITYYRQGNETKPPDQISVVTSKNSTIAYGDWKGF